MLRIDDAQAPKIIAVGEDSCKIVGVPYYFLSPHFHDTIYQFPMDADQGIYRINERLKPAKSFIEIPPLGHSPLSFIKALPSAYLRSLFRPFPFERNDKLMTLSGLENALLMVLFILVFVYGNTTLLKQSGLLYILLVGSCYLTSIGWLTPNYGTLMRYKIIGLSLLLPPLVLVFPWRKKSKK